jgi:hypothetical protein
MATLRNRFHSSIPQLQDAPTSSYMSTEPSTSMGWGAAPLGRCSEAVCISIRSAGRHLTLLTLVTCGILQLMSIRQMLRRITRLAALRSPRCSLILTLFYWFRHHWLSRGRMIAGLGTGVRPPILDES